MNKKIHWKKINSETKSVWAGETESFPHGATQTPTVNSVAYAYNDLDEWVNVSKGKKDGHKKLLERGINIHSLMDF